MHEPDGHSRNTPDLATTLLPVFQNVHMVPEISFSAGVLFWFRHDLRLHDQPALQAAIAQAEALGGWLLPVFVEEPSQNALTSWGFARTGEHRRLWQSMALDDLRMQLDKLGCPLLHLHGPAVQVLSRLARLLRCHHVVCEDIPAPHEMRDVAGLRQAGLQVQTIWQSTLIAPEQLPFDASKVPDHFTAFRQAVEATGIRAAAPLPVINRLPPAPPSQMMALVIGHIDRVEHSPLNDCLPDIPGQAAFRLDLPALHGGERAALSHLQGYCARGLPHSYKATRNGLMGTDFSSKWSPWLATGALSARQAWTAIENFEAEQGANEGTYWLWFELLWRDHFRWLHLKHGAQLYRPEGLSDHALPGHDPSAFKRWCEGRTGHAFIDAGMRELARTGYLSNRMRQNVASYLIHDLECDWRAGAAWFEARLIDFDVCSNQGNWLYLSGRGTDPRGQRRFNPDKQARDHDPDGVYRQLWSVPYSQESTCTHRSPS